MDRLSDFHSVPQIIGVVRGGEEYSLQTFVTPRESLIQELATTLLAGGNFIKDTQDFVHAVVKYTSDKGDYWEYPRETLFLGRGDCEDSSLLLVSLLRNFMPPEDVYAVCGDWKGEGHMWVVANWQIIESTAGSSKVINESVYSPEVFFNDAYAWMKETNTFGFTADS